MFEYADIYMSSKVKGIRYVVLNVYGGEALYHPDIIDILERCRQKYQESYSDKWHLTITTTTNAILPEKKLQAIIPLIDEFTVSYHAENDLKKKSQFKNNLLLIKNSGKRLKCVVLMHTDPELFSDTLSFQSWLKNNEISLLPRQLDHHTEGYQTKQQIIWFDEFYKKKQQNKEQNVEYVNVKDDKYNIKTGRACCGGRQLCLDTDYKNRSFYVKNSFKDWYCSVNEFFVYIKQTDGNIFTNKDCQMNFHNQVGPIGNLSDASGLLETTKEILSMENSRPVIRCQKDYCYCGLCAPKSQDFEKYNSIMEKYRT